MKEVKSMGEKHYIVTGRGLEGLGNDTTETASFFYDSFKNEYETVHLRQQPHEVIRSLWIFLRVHLSLALLAKIVHIHVL